ncbi:MAG: hypothetical protein QNJ47_01960 [Nostocaceae cyanobacterium]|nr:hypothetical protein [Nostocaceae cyanobacterium]
MKSNIVRMNPLRLNNVFILLLMGVLVTSCSGGTSSNTSSNPGGGTSSNNSLTVSIPALGRQFQVVRGQTTEADINNTADAERSNCNVVFSSIPSQLQVCRSQVSSAVRQALDFIR